jgi:hypothetical protein
MNKDVHTLKTGDLLLFEGTGFISKLIKIFTDSHISHAAMVWRCPITNEPYIWETGDVDQDSVPMITRNNRPMNAAHLIPLKVKLKQKHYNKIYVRRLKIKDGYRLDDARLDCFIARNLGKLYTTNLVSLWSQRYGASLINLPFLEDESEFTSEHEYREFHCSQLVLLSYYEIGIIKWFDGYTHTITPGDMFDDIVTMPGYDFEKPEIIYKL